ncbi:MAG: hypothetical protein J7L54_02835 [Elusimicrobia bacterium]|nr:hypothetical protein [Elusimicrobiota bacterium]
MKKIKSLTNPSYHQADVWLVEKGGKFLVWKDFSKWRFLGRLIIAREVSFYRRLQGIKGIPKFYGMPTKSSFLMEYIDGQPIDAFSGLDEKFFRRLEKLVGEIHSRGVLHFDLRHKSNIIVRGGYPYIIDLGTCFYSHILVLLLSWIDRAALIHLKQVVSPNLLTPLERRQARIHNRLSKLWFFNRIFKGD